MFYVWPYKEIVTRCLCIRYLAGLCNVFTDSCKFFVLGNIIILLNCFYVVFWLNKNSLWIFQMKLLDYSGINSVNREQLPMWLVEDKTYAN